MSRLARELGISRALLQVHLRKLQAAGLVTAAIEVSEDGKAMKFYEVAHCCPLEALFSFDRRRFSSACGAEATRGPKTS